MGKAGMKRKGRQHLPKAGTRPAYQHELYERRRRALHPFSTDPSRRGGTGYAIAAAVIAIVVVIGIIGLMALT